MKLVITEQNNTAIEVETVTTNLTIADFDTAAGKVPASIFTAKGSLVAGTGNGTYAELPVGASNTILQPNALATTGLGWTSFVSPSALYPTQGRLTLESAVPVSITDQAAKTVLYYALYNGDQIGLYDGAWALCTFSQLSIKTTDAQTGTTTNGSKVISGLSDTSQFIVGMEITGTNVGGGSVIATIDSATQVTGSVNSTGSATNTITFKVPASKNLDVFCYSNNGTPKLEFCQWTNDTTRATALTTQNGIYVKTGAATRRYLGTVGTNATAGVMDDIAGGSDLPGNRLVWNYYNREKRFFQTFQSAGSWTYQTASYRKVNNNDYTRLNFIVGVANTAVDAHHHSVNSGAASAVAYIAIGLDSATVPATYQPYGNVSVMNMYVRYLVYPTAGRHYLQALEKAAAAAATTFYGTVGSALAFQELGGYIMG